MSHLRLVGAPEPPKPKRRRHCPTPLLPQPEEARFRAAMRGLRDAFGTWGALAAAMDVRKDSITQMVNGKVAVSGDMIIRAMRASGLSYEQLMGSPKLAGTCRACGAVRCAS